VFLLRARFAETVFGFDDFVLDEDVVRVDEARVDEDLSLFYALNAVGRTRAAAKSAIPRRLSIRTSYPECGGLSNVRRTEAM
jgi:hypothetical protein